METLQEVSAMYSLEGEAHYVPGTLLSYMNTVCNSYTIVNIHDM